MFRNKKNNFHIYIYFFLLTFLIFFILYKTPGLKGGIDQEVRILTKEPIIIDGRYPLKQSLPNIIIVIKNLFNFKNKNYENIKIDINYKNFDKLRQDRARSLKNKILKNPSTVDLKLNWKGKEISASGRLKGDFNDHRNFNKQWSMKFNLKNSDHIDGMTEFSITNHRSRNFPFNFIISKNLERMGLHVPKFKTVKVNFNGYDWGIMLIEEHFTKEFLENRKLKNNLIFKLSNEQIVIFEHMFLYNQIIDTTEFHYLTKWQDKFYVSYHNQNKISKKKMTYEKKDFISKVNLMKSLNEKINLQNIDTSDTLIEKYFDLKSFAVAIASSLAWGEGSFHSLDLNNVRFYINPYTLKISVIPADYDFIFYMYKDAKNEKNYLDVINANLKDLPTIYQPIIKNKKFQNYYLEALKEFDRNLKNIISDTNSICSNYSEICNKYVKISDLKKNINNLKYFKTKIFNSYSESYKKLHKDRDVVIEKYFKKNNPLNQKYHDLYTDFVDVRVFSNGTLNIKNLTNLDLHIDSVELGDLSFKKKINLILNGSKYKDLENLNLDLGFKLKINSSVKLNYSINKNQELKIYETSVEKKMNLLNKKVSYYDFEKNKIKIKNNDIIFEGKEYIIDKPIIVPNNFNLIILDGANLKFDENAYILINNGALKILGKKNNKVFLSELNNQWKGIHVISNNHNSEINYANFSNLDYFQNGKFNLTGAINFYNSNVKINYSRFDVSNSEDSLNFIKSNFFVNECIFSKSRSDAIDSDYSNGLIQNSKFLDTGGDAIDTSGSMVDIEGVEILNVGDKGISVGENSRVNLWDVKIKNAKIGIASKDSSKVFGDDILIKNSKFLDLASYNKKKIFEGGNIKIKKIISDNKYLSQENSFIEINNNIIDEKNFNTSDLY